MNFFKKNFPILLILISASCTAPREQNNDHSPAPVDQVNPYMGNISHLLVPTFPTVHLPNSFLRITPNRADFTAVTLRGFPLVLTGHRGSKAFTLSPYQGPEEAMEPEMEYSYDQEKLTPYSYSVYLDEQRIQADLGVSHQSAAYAFQFQEDAPAYLVLNARNGVLRWDGGTVSGYQEIGSGTRAYVYLLCSEQPQEVKLRENGTWIPGAASEGRDACLALEYPAGTKQIQVRYGISFIDEAQARANMEREIAGKSLAEIQETGRELWNKELGKIRVEGGTPDQRTVFYTSLYRCYERPVCISEDGRYYSPFDKQVHEDQGRPFYTDDWIWDTYRAQHPLRILIDAEREEDMIHSLILSAAQKEHFWMPTFPTITGDRHAMNGNHGVATVLDAYRKGLNNFDLELAYEASRGAVMEKTLAPWSADPAGELDQFYKDHGYIPALREGEAETIPEVHDFEQRQAVAVTLGTAYDQWCLAELADILGKEEDAAYFREASFNYRRLFNAETKFFHPRDAQGNFIEPFDYRFSGGMGARRYYDENNGWIFRWDVPHNIPDLVELMGGSEAFADGLDAMFTEPLGRSKYAFYAQLPDHTGNVGQFSMGNETSLHIPYLYNYADRPWKTQKVIRKLLQEWFRNDLMGVPGDEDGGGLSSFVVFSSMGFYPVTPGDPVYTLGSPMFERVTVDLGNGETFEIEARNASPENKYIQSATLNGKALNTPWFPHEALSGGRLVLDMGPRANTAWGIQ
jgi:predicted alpha-1,2-mannosidase